MKSPTTQQRSQFQAYFKKNLMAYCHPFLGFDIVRFDEDMKCPDGVSLKQHITKNQGAQASELIADLINL